MDICHLTEAFPQNGLLLKRCQ